MSDTTDASCGRQLYCKPWSIANHKGESCRYHVLAGHQAPADCEEAQKW